jgi:hypothetical protein
VRRLSVVGIATALVVLVSACAGGGTDAEVKAEAASAVLAVVDPVVTVDTGEGFVEAVDGSKVEVGGSVRVDAAGVAALKSGDVAWVRVGNGGTMKLDGLAEGDAEPLMSVSLDTGSLWARVRPAEGSGAPAADAKVAVATPVGSAAGVAFATACEGAAACTFSAVEGDVVVTPGTGEPVKLTAGQSLRVAAGEVPPAPAPAGITALIAEPFVARNLELDSQQGVLSPTQFPEAQVAGIAGTYDIKRVVTASESETNPVGKTDFAKRTFEVTCEAGVCQVRRQDIDEPAFRAGDGIRFSYNREEPCGSSQDTYANNREIVYRFEGDRVTGEQGNVYPRRCPGTPDSWWGPVTVTLDGTRVAG